MQMKRGTQGHVKGIWQVRNEVKLHQQLSVIVSELAISEQDILYDTVRCFTSLILQTLNWPSAMQTNAI